MELNKHLLNTGTEILFFDQVIRKHRALLEPRSVGFFTCGSFMRNISPKKTIFSPKGISEDCLILIRDNRWGFQDNLVHWWFDKLKELDIYAEYFGKEDNIHYILYKIRKMPSPSVRLLRFTMVRYLWSTPYRTLIEHMYKIKDLKEIKEHGFWPVFMKYHVQLSTFRNYSDVFGLTHSSIVTKFTNQEIIDKFIKPTNKDYGINSMFCGMNYKAIRSYDKDILFKKTKFDYEK